MRVAPRPVVAGDRQLELEPLVVRLEVLVGDRPVLPHPVARADLEVGRMEAGAVARVVDHRAADAVTAVVLAELDRVGSADDPLLVPVQPVRAGLVGHPVLVRVPERAGLEHDHLPAAAREPLRERAAAGAGADDHQVDGEPVVVARHPLLRNGAPVDVEQERRVVLGRPERARAAASAARGAAAHCLPALALAGADAGVAARVRRAAEADLVPRPRVRVERAQDRARHDLPGARRRQLVPHLAVQLSIRERVDDPLLDLERRIHEVDGSVLARRRVEPEPRPAATSRGRRACPRSESRRARRRTAWRRPCSAPGSSALSPGRGRGRRTRRASAPRAR